MFAMSDWMWKVCCCLLIVHLSNGIGAYSKYSRSNEICSVNNGKRIYLELGDRGMLQATNISVPSFLNGVSFITTLSISNDIYLLVL